MRLNKKLRSYFYRSLSALVALAIITSSFALQRSAVALNPPVATPAQPPLVANGDAGVCAANLATAIDPIVDDPTFAKGRWGVLAKSLTDGRVLYSHNATETFIPASNTKLFTTAAAVQSLNQLDPVTSEDWLHSISLANRDSNNNQADLLLDRVGGVSAIREAITPLGVDPNTYRQVDGSGLSRSNRAEPEAFVDLLKGIATTPENRLFYDSLSIAGMNGTLRNRLQEPAVYGRVHAKTGTLTGVRSLSGYIENPYYGPIVFSILLNQSGKSGKVMTDAIDEIVVNLAQTRSCG
jgi:serine-type D-Ala-D-Ala carboxypeptidase/endopeptidase (penicillin-binding protein 4)